MTENDSATKKQPPTVKGQPAKTVAVTISGRAKDSAGKPVAGATINLCVGSNMNRAAASTTTSDSDGHYVFKDVELPLQLASGSQEPHYAGGFSLYGTAAGHGFAWSGSRTFWDRVKPSDVEDVPGDWRRRPGGVDFYRDEPTIVDLEFTPATSLKGRVIDDEGHPIRDVELSLWHADYFER